MAPTLLVNLREPSVPVRCTEQETSPAPSPSTINGEGGKKQHLHHPTTLISSRWRAGGGCGRGLSPSQLPRASRRRGDALGHGGMQRFAPLWDSHFQTAHSCQAAAAWKYRSHAGSPGCEGQDEAGPGAAASRGPSRDWWAPRGGSASVQAGTKCQVSPGALNNAVTFPQRP